MNADLAAFNAQYAFLREHVPFYAKRHRRAAPFTTREDALAGTPLVRKSEMRGARPFDLLPRGATNALSSYTIHRGTGGSTGEPTSILYSCDDWAAAISWAGSWIRDELASVERPLLAFNNYHQGHVSGPAFNDFLRAAGGLAITRNFGATDEGAIRQMEAHGCNVLVAPPVSTHKGGTLETLLDADAKRPRSYINGDSIDAIIVSSTALTPELRNELRALGIERVIDFYGSTDVLPVAASSAKCRSLHLVDGFAHASVLTADQMHVRPGERGLVVAGRLARQEGAAYRPSVSTALLMFVLGDSALYEEGACACGRVGPRIGSIQRVEDIEEKLATGCEAW